MVGFASAHVWLQSLYLALGSEDLSVTSFSHLSLCCSHPVRATRSVIPGESFADLCMCLVLLAACDEIVATFSSKAFYLAQLADDLLIMAIGSKEHVAQAVACASQQLVAKLEGCCCLTASDPKLVMVSTHKEITDAVVRSQPRLAKAPVSLPII